METEFPHWKVSLNHERAWVEAKCESLGLPIPVHEKGRVNKPKENLLTRHNAKEFWEALEKRGHSHPNINQCSCRNRNPNDLKE